MRRLSQDCTFVLQELNGPGLDPRQLQVVQRVGKHDRRVLPHGRRVELGHDVHGVGLTGTLRSQIFGEDCGCYVCCG